jgi:cystathionine gamma-synthase
VRDLFTQPLCRLEDLGNPIPDSPHAVSVTIPTWDSVIGYEEEDPQVMATLRCGYPRFFCHPLVKRLFERAVERFAGEKETALVFASNAAARRCAAFLCRVSGESLAVAHHDWGEGSAASVLVFPQALRREGLLYWRYCGEIVSSRQAQQLLGEGEAIAEAVMDSANVLGKRLASWAGEPSSQVHLFPSGMAAIHAAFRAVTTIRPGLKTVQLEFPYVDVFCIQKSLGVGVHHVLGKDMADQLTGLLRKEKIAAVFCEIPSNPLMRTVNLEIMSRVCRRHRVPLIVDDTIGTVHNVDVYPFADLVTTSLTKNISGQGDVMGGALTVPVGSAFAEAFQQFLTKEQEPGLWVEDAAVLDRSSRNFPQRMAKLNYHAELLFEFLAGHLKVADLYYPKQVTRDAYTSILRKGGGFGGLLSFTLKDTATTPAFYDRLEVCKGPSLGMDFTLACPYTLLAHYEELDWAEACGVSRHLVRVGVGLENPKALIERFERALG